jgi:hypothetical protein
MIAVLLVAFLVALLPGLAGAVPDEPSPPPPGAGAPSSSDEEAAVLRELFILGRTLEETRVKIGEAGSRIAELAQSQAETQAERDRLEARRRERQALLGKRLRFYQEQGRVAPFAVLLGATSLEDFLERIDLLSRIVAMDAKLLRELRGLRDGVAAHEEGLRRDAQEQARLRTALQQEQAKLQADIAQREAVLASLREQRTAVEARLQELEQAWQAQVLPVLEALGSALAGLNPAAFQPDSVVMSLFPPGATATISAGNLGRFLAQQPELKGLTCRVEPGVVSLEGEFEGVAVRIGGTFKVASKTALRFELGAVRVREFDVPPAALGQLVNGGAVDVEMGAMVTPFSLQDVTLAEGQIRIRAGLR